MYDVETWPKELRDVLLYRGYYIITAIARPCWCGNGNRVRVRRETMGNYPRYGWRVWIREYPGSTWSSFFVEKTAELIDWIMEH